MASHVSTRDRSAAHRRTTALRYAAYQVPGGLVVGGGCVALWSYDVVSAAAAGLVAAGWIVKDVAMYPLVRRAYEPAPSPAERLVGCEATVHTPLAPRGFVRVGAELWRAELESGVPEAPRGSRVVVASVEGLTLRVHPADLRTALSREAAGTAPFETP